MVLFKRRESKIEEANKNLFFGVEHENITYVRNSLKNGADVNLKNQVGQSALAISASRASKAGIILELLDCGADIEQRDSKDMTPLMIAAEVGNVMAMEILLNRKAQINAKTDKGLAVLDFAVRNGNPKNLELLLNRIGWDILVLNEGLRTKILGLGHANINMIIKEMEEKKEQNKLVERENKIDEIIRELDGDKKE